LDQHLKTIHLLSGFLADELVLSAKTRYARWNSTGPGADIFKQQLEQLDAMMDGIVAHIHLHQQYIPANLKDLLSRIHLSERFLPVNDNNSNIKELLADHEAIIIRFREYIDELNKRLHDDQTIPFIKGMVEAHEKMAWMLRAQLK
jgi:starvation-inducible DNA-binding protein